MRDKLPQSILRGRKLVSTSQRTNGSVVRFDRLSLIPCTPDFPIILKYSVPVYRTLFM